MPNRRTHLQPGTHARLAVFYLQKYDIGDRDVTEPAEIFQSDTDFTFKGRVERIFFFASFKLPLFNEYKMVFIIV